MSRSVEVDSTKIRRLRDQMVLNRYDLATRAGLSEKSIENAENGASVDRRTVQKLAKAFNVEPDFLLKRPKRSRTPMAVTTATPIASFQSPEQVTKFIDELRKACGAKARIYVVAIENGSTIFQIEATRHDARRILRAFLDNRLQSLWVTAIAIPLRFYRDEVSPTVYAVTLLKRFYRWKPGYLGRLAQFLMLIGGFVAFEFAREMPPHPVKWITIVTLSLLLMIGFSRAVLSLWLADTASAPSSITGDWVRIALVAHVPSLTTIPQNAPGTPQAEGIPAPNSGSTPPDRNL